jgi:hypothetical protein
MLSQAMTMPQEQRWRKFYNIILSSLQRWCSHLTVTPKTFFLFINPDQI